MTKPAFLPAAETMATSLQSIYNSFFHSMENIRAGMTYRGFTDVGVQVILELSSSKYSDNKLGNQNHVAMALISFFNPYTNRHESARFNLPLQPSQNTQPRHFPHAGLEKLDNEFRTAKATALRNFVNDLENMRAIAGEQGEGALVSIINSFINEAIANNLIEGPAPTETE